MQNQLHNRIHVTFSPHCHYYKHGTSCSERAIGKHLSKRLTSNKSQQLLSSILLSAWGHPKPTLQCTAVEVFSAFSTHTVFCLFLANNQSSGSTLTHSWFPNWGWKTLKCIWRYLLYVETIVTELVVCTPECTLVKHVLTADALHT